MNYIRANCGHDVPAVGAPGSICRRNEERMCHNCRRTPWGDAQQRTPLGDKGIVSVSTASHGGIFVPDELLSSIPEKHKAWAASWSGSRNWYEEDCCWACVAVAFPDLFKVEEVIAARRTLAGYPELS
jgi:hypothetical protein